MFRGVTSILQMKRMKYEMIFSVPRVLLHSIMWRIDGGLKGPLSPPLMAFKGLYYPPPLPYASNIFKIEISPIIIITRNCARLAR